MILTPFSRTDEHSCHSQPKSEKLSWVEVTDWSTAMTGLCCALMIAQIPSIQYYFRLVTGDSMVQ